MIIAKSIVLFVSVLNNLNELLKPLKFAVNGDFEVKKNSSLKENKF